MRPNNCYRTPLKAKKLQNSVIISSADESVCASLFLESFWCGNTVYPAAPVLTISHKGGGVVRRSLLSFQSAAEDLICYGLEIKSVKRQSQETRFGPGRQVVVRLCQRHGLIREIEITLRVTGISAFCGICPPRKLMQTGCDRSRFQFVDGAVFHSGKDEKPVVAYAPSSLLFAYWHHADEHHLVMLERPGSIAEMKFDVLKAISEIQVENGADGCRMIYTRLPFTKAILPAALYGENIRTSYKVAFDEFLVCYNCGDDDFWLMRGEPGVFAVGARRNGSCWSVFGITSKARTLTVRFEDLWLRMPPEMRELKWNVTLIRDPVNDEPGELVKESFDDLAPDIRIALDLKKDGGFLMKFSPISSVWINLLEVKNSRDSRSEKRK